MGGIRVTLETAREGYKVKDALELTSDHHPDRAIRRQLFKMGEIARADWRDALRGLANARVARRGRGETSPYSYQRLLPWNALMEHLAEDPEIESKLLQSVPDGPLSAARWCTFAKALDIGEIVDFPWEAA